MVVDEELLKLHRLLNIDRSDFPILALLAPIFAMSAAVTVILASLSKALFLVGNPVSLLPWMFLGAAVISAGTSLGYLKVLSRVPLTKRAGFVFGGAAVSLLGLRLLFTAQLDAASIIVLLWCSALSNLVVLQTWNLATSTLPTRQAKRLLPILASVTTAGALVGGLLVQFLVPAIFAENLLLFGVLLLVAIACLVSSVSRALLAPLSVRDHTTPSEDSREGSGVALITKSPMLTSMALFVFFAASRIADCGLSAERRAAAPLRQGRHRRVSRHLLLGVQCRRADRQHFRDESFRT